MCGAASDSIVYGTVGVDVFFAANNAVYDGWTTCLSSTVSSSRTNARYTVKI
jgi:hypothetical protein